MVSLQIVPFAVGKLLLLASSQLVNEHAELHSDSQSWSSVQLCP